MKWEILPMEDRIALHTSMIVEGEKQNSINVVSNHEKVLSMAMLTTVDELKEIVMHDWAKERPSFPWNSKLVPSGKPRTIGAIWDRMKIHNIQFKGDWFNDCAPIYHDFQPGRLRVFVSYTSDDDRRNGCSGEYLITDGAHRVFAFLRLLDEGKLVFQPIPVFSTVVNQL
jgi:hypothetical protein